MRPGLRFIFFFACGCPIISATICWESVFPLLNCFCTFVKNWLGVFVWFPLWVLYSVLLICTCISPSIPHSYDGKSWSWFSLSLYSSFSNCSDSSSSFAFYINTMYVLSLFYLLSTTLTFWFSLSNFLYPYMFSNLSSISLIKCPFKSILFFITCNLFFTYSISVCLVSFHCLFSSFVIVVVVRWGLGIHRLVLTLLVLSMCAQVHLVCLLKVLILGWCVVLQLSFVT